MDILGNNLKYRVEHLEDKIDNINYIMESQKNLFSQLEDLKHENSELLVGNMKKDNHIEMLERRIDELLNHLPDINWN